MFGYTEVTVVVDGALETVEQFNCNDPALDAFIAKVEADAVADGLLTEVYTLFHEHDETQDCECVQYLTDHHPAYVFNALEHPDADNGYAQSLGAEGGR